MNTANTAEEGASHSRQLRVLMVEDSFRDAELSEGHFTTSGYQVSIDRAATFEMQDALATRHYDIVIANCGVSEFWLIPALELLKQSGRDIPLIILSDSISEEMAVAAIRVGASDHFVQNNLARIFPAVEKGGREAMGHPQKAEMEPERHQEDEFAYISELRLQGIIDSAMDAIISLDAQQRIIVFNKAAENIFGCAASDAIGLSLDRFIPLHRREIHHKHIGDFGATGVATWSMNSLTGVRSNGEEFPIEAKISQIEAGEERFLTIFMRDLTERSHAKELLRQSEEQLGAFYDHAAVGIEHTGLDGRLQMTNPAFRKLLGYSESELLGKTFEEITHPEDRGRELLLVQSMLDGERDSYALEKRYLHKDGSPLWVRVTSSLLKDAGRQPLSRVTIVQNIAEWKRAERLEETLHQAQKLESLGRLAGAVAHDFDTLLTIILGYAGLLLHDLPQGDPQRARVEQIEVSANRAAQLTEQLLGFSRKQLVVPQVADLNKVVLDMEPMLLRRLPEDIHVKIHCSESTCPVKVDLGRIQQVVLNLVTNAREAMPMGGNLTIDVGTVEFEVKSVQNHSPMVAGQYGMLAVRDTGTGMDSETMARLFEPFFTTKESGKGTGLGLSTVYGIVRQSGGDIWVDSSLGVGSVFKVYLPHSMEPVEVAELAPPVPLKLSGTETILLVEDSAILRELTRELLTRQGYLVLEAADGIDALDLSSTYEGKIHLLLTDIVMPRMRGTELAERIGEQRPRTGVMFLSGYAEDALSHMKGIGQLMIVQKPYNANTLLLAVRQALDRLQRAA